MVQGNREVQGEMYKDLGLEQLPCQSERLVQRPYSLSSLESPFFDFRFSFFSFFSFFFRFLSAFSSDVSPSCLFRFLESPFSSTALDSAGTAGGGASTGGIGGALSTSACVVVSVFGWAAVPFSRGALKSL
jgi:hypothetical protein